MQVTRTRPKLTVTADGVVSHAGTRLLADLADATGLTHAFSDALTGLRRRDAGHDPDRVAVDVAVMLADGGQSISNSLHAAVGAFHRRRIGFHACIRARRHMTAGVR
jgi:hypothetical protein